MRLAFVTDWHIGAPPEKAMWQPFWTDSAGVLVDRLRRFVDEQQVETLLLGGDLVHEGIAEQIEPVVDSLSRIDRPVVLALGNHDLTEPDSLSRWRDAVRSLPNLTLADAAQDWETCSILAMNNVWEGPDGYGFLWRGDWEMGCRAHLSAEQGSWLDEQLARTADRPTILLMHANLDALPHEWAAQEKTDHAPETDLPEKLEAMLAKHPHCRLVLCGHCHVNRIVTDHDRYRVTAAACREMPGLARIIDVEPDQIRLGTEPLGDRDAALFNESRWWVAGEEADRACTIALR